MYSGGAQTSALAEAESEPPSGVPCAAEDSAPATGPREAGSLFAAKIESGALTPPPPPALSLAFCAASSELLAASYLAFLLALRAEVAAAEAVGVPSCSRTVSPATSTPSLEVSSGWAFR